MSDDANVASDFEDVREWFEGDSMAATLLSVVGFGAEEADAGGGPVVLGASLAGRWVELGCAWRLRRTVFRDRVSAR